MKEAVSGDARSLVFAVVVLLAACKPKPGDKCAEPGVCFDRQTALLCGANGRYEAAACKGPDGCTEGPLRCDFRGNAHGERCVDLADGHPMQCTADKKARVRCSEGKVDRDECDGPKGCYSKTATTTACDRAYKAGAACSVDGDWCSNDNLEWLKCRDKKMFVAARCRGPLRCTSLTDAIACDTSVGEPNDPCVGEGKSCSVDGKAVLACKGASLVVDTSCAEGKTCRPSSSTPACN